MKKRDIDYNQFDQEKEINLLDVIEETFRRVWLLVVMIIVFCIVAVAFKYSKNKSDAAEAAAEAESIAAEESASASVAAAEQEAAAASAATLTESGKESAQKIVELEALYDAKEEYMANSILMQIDPYNENKIALQFALTGDSDVVYVVASSLSSYISEGYIAGDIAQYYPDTASKYLAELISVSLQSDDQETAGTVGIHIDICHTSADACSQLAAYVKAAVEAFVSEEAASLGNCTLSLTGQYSSNVVDSDLITLKESNTTYMENIQTQIDTLYSEMNTAARQYLEELRAGQTTDATGADITAQAEVSLLSAALPDSQAKIIKTSADEGESETGEIAEEEEETYTDGLVIFAILGIIVGIVVAAIINALYMALRGTVDDGEELQKLLNIPVFGRINKYEKNNVLVKAWRKITGKGQKISFEEEEKLIIANILSECKGREVSKVLFACSAADISGYDFIEKIAEALKAEGIESATAGSVIYSADSTRMLDEYDDVIIVEKIAKSKVNDVIECMKRCMERDINVCGAVVIG